LEKLAMRKLTKHYPTLTPEWNSSLEAHRKLQGLLKMQDQDKKRVERIGVGLSLSPTKLKFR
jgi:hypothetical protein